jgi:nucleoside-diphosphate-sugar epimerase
VSDWKDRSVLITGATGFIGSHVAERLVAAGARVRVLVRDPQKLIPVLLDRVEVARGDLLQPACFASAVIGCEIVFHVAGWLGTPASHAAAYALNVTATRQLAEAARDAGAQRFVVTSSVAVYGPVKAGVVDEMWPHWNVYAYAETKSQGEPAAFAAMTDRFGVSVIRPAEVYGPRGGAWTTLPINLAKRGLPMLIGGGQGYSHPVYVENLVDAYLLAATRDEARGEAFSICDADIPWREFYGRYAALVGKPARSVPTWVAWCGALAAEAKAAIMRQPANLSRAQLGFMTGRCVYTTEKARRLLGWSPRFSLEEGMQRTAAWLHTAGLLD